jgi:hypothetical protein
MFEDALPRLQTVPELLLAAVEEVLVALLEEELLVVVVELELVVMVELELVELVEPPPLVDVVVVELVVVEVVNPPPSDPLLVDGPELVVVLVVWVVVPPPDEGPFGSTGFAQPYATTTHPAATTPASFQWLISTLPSTPIRSGNAMRRATR